MLCLENQGKVAPLAGAAPEALIRGTDGGGGFVELLTRCHVLPLADAAFRVELEGVSCEAGNDVEMQVQDELRGGLAVGEEEIDPFAA